MISDITVRKILNLIFLEPQRVLGGTTEERKLDNVHLVSIKLLSGTPINGRGCKMDPILIKIGFSGIDDETDICNLTEEQIQIILESLKMFDELVGSWTLLHDIPVTEKTPQWRMASEVSPISIRTGKIEKTNDKNSRKILCIELEGVGIFMGKPKNSKNNQ